MTYSQYIGLAIDLGLFGIMTIVLIVLSIDEARQEEKSEEGNVEQPRDAA